VFEGLLSVTGNERATLEDTIATVGLKKACHCCLQRVTNPSEFTLPYPNKLSTDQSQPTHFALTAQPAVEKRTVPTLLLHHEVLALLVVGRITNGALAGLAGVLRVETDDAAPQTVLNARRAAFFLERDIAAPHFRAHFGRGTAWRHGRGTPRRIKVRVSVSLAVPAVPQIRAAPTTCALAVSHCGRGRRPGKRPGKRPRVADLGGMQPWPFRARVKTHRPSSEAPVSVSVYVSVEVPIPSSAPLLEGPQGVVQLVELAPLLGAGLAAEPPFHVATLQSRVSLGVPVGSPVSVVLAAGPPPSNTPTRVPVSISFAFSAAVSGVPLPVPIPVTVAQRPSCARFSFENIAEIFVAHELGLGDVSKVIGGCLDLQSSGQ